MDDQVLAGLRAWGAPEAMVRAWAQRAASDEPQALDPDFSVLPENWGAVKFFLACETQWVQVAGMTAVVRTGLDYQRCESVARGLGLKWRTVFPALQLMERAALERMGELLNEGSGKK